MGVNFLEPIQMCSPREILGDDEVIRRLSRRIDREAESSQNWPETVPLSERRSKLTDIVFELIQDLDADLAARLGRAYSVKEEHLLERDMLANQIACKAGDTFQRKHERIILDTDAGNHRVEKETDEIVNKTDEMLLRDILAAGKL